MKAGTKNEPESLKFETSNQVYRAPASAARMAYRAALTLRPFFQNSLYGVPSLLSPAALL
jgi:hypothetical protein